MVKIRRNIVPDHLVALWRDEVLTTVFSSRSSRYFSTVCPLRFRPNLSKRYESERCLRTDDTFDASGHYIAQDHRGAEQMSWVLYKTGRDKNDRRVAGPVAMLHRGAIVASRRPPTNPLRTHTNRFVDRGPLHGDHRFYKSVKV